jgi:hypothetical protein
VCELRDELDSNVHLSFDCSVAVIFAQEKPSAIASLLTVGRVHEQVYTRDPWLDRHVCLDFSYGRH